MPRVTAAHEQQVRERIVAAALATFNELGYHRATMQDVVRRSGLSVGAIYTYFRGKDDLFLACCDLASGQGIEEVARRVAQRSTVTEKLATAIALYLDTMEPSEDGEAGQVTYLIQAWAEAQQSPLAREMLVRRRDQLTTIGRLLLEEGIARGELPAWLDSEGVSLGFGALLDGLLLQRVEAGAAWRRDDAERRAFAMLEAVLGAAAATERPRVERPAPAPPGLPKSHLGTSLA